MHASKLGKSMLKYLPLLAVVVAVIAGTLIGKDLYSRSRDAGIQAATALQIEQARRLPWERNTPEVLIYPATAGTCFGPLIYTSLPPKCKTIEGEFIQLPGSSEVFVLPPK